MVDTPEARSLPVRTKKGRKFASPEALEAENARLSSFTRGKDVTEYEEVLDLPKWVRLCIAEAVTLGKSYKDVVAKYDRSYNTLLKYTRSPAATKWIGEIRRVSEDPEKLATTLLRGSVAGVTFDYLLALENAISAQDYREVGVMSRDILDRMGVTKQKGGGGAARPTIVINLGSNSIDIPMVESTYEEHEGGDAGSYWTTE